MAACSHARILPRIQVLQPSPRTASTPVEKSFNHRHRKLQWHCTKRESCNRCWILLLPAKLFATSIRQSYDLARTTMIFFAATVAGFCYYRWRFLLHPVDKKASTRQRNTGKVTTVLTKSFNPQMKKASNRDRENPPRRRPWRLSVFLLQPQSKKLQPFVKKLQAR